MAKKKQVKLHKNQPLPSFMAHLTKEKATGTLVATSEDAKREIAFVDGEIRAARSNLEEEKLGLWLVHREKISEDDRALTLLSQGGGDSPPLGHILVTRGCFPQDELEHELQELALAIIRGAAAAPGTVCEFIEGSSEGQLDTLPNITTTRIALLTAREFNQIDVKRAAIGSGTKIVELADSSQEILEELELTPTEGFFLSRLDGTSSVSSLIQLSSLPEDEAYSTLYTLLVAGVLSVTEGGSKTDKKKTSTAKESTKEFVEAEADASFEEASYSDLQQEERLHIRKLSDEITKVDHYRALGLNSSADADQIDRAWENIQKDFSAKRSSEKHLHDMTEHLERIIERGRVAHELLSNIRARRRYDHILETVEEERERLENPGRGPSDPTARRNLVEANFKRADELVHDGELYLAIQLLEQACALDPQPPELLKLSRLLLRNPLWTNRGLTCIRRAIEADPKCVEAWLELAEFWRRRNHAERQRKSLERALSVDPDNEQANKMYVKLAGKKELERLLRRARQMR